jgi:hypothetical protein
MYSLKFDLYICVLHFVAPEQQQNLVMPPWLLSLDTINAKNHHACTCLPTAVWRCRGIRF